LKAFPLAPLLRYSAGLSMKAPLLLLLLQVQVLLATVIK
jgi:hypothetical protein